MATGKIVQIIGAVIDVEFPQDAVPKVYEALNVETGLVLEVQQQLGGGVVRCIAMGSSDGLKRGLSVTNTGSPISVPVGTETLGRIMNVLGEPIDERGPIGEKLVGQFTVLHQVMKNKQTVQNCWKPVSKLSTWFARLRKGVKLVCSVVRV